MKKYLKTPKRLNRKRKSGSRVLSLVLSFVLLILAFPVSSISIKTNASEFLDSGEPAIYSGSVPNGTEAGKTESETGSREGGTETECETGTEVRETETKSEDEAETKSETGGRETESETGTGEGEAETKPETGTEGRETEPETGRGEGGTETKSETETGGGMAETESETGTDRREKEAGKAYFYRDELVEVEVVLSADTAVPADAVLTVRAIADDDKAYDTLAQQAEKAVPGETEQILLYDISFYTAKKEYLSVADTARVSIRFKQAVLEESSGEIAVLHYGEKAAAPVALTEVDVERGKNDALSGLTFQTEGFSIYAVVAVSADDFETETPDVKKLDGKSYAVLSNTGKFAMLAQESGTAGKLAYHSGISGLTDTGIWTFQSASGGTGYYISCGTQYLNMSSGGKLTLTEKRNASVFTVSLSGGDEQHVLIHANGNYINSYGGEGNISGFAGWSGNDAGSQLLLYKMSQNHAMNLNGKRFAIVNQAMGVAMTNTAQDAEANQRGLGAQPVTFVSGTDYVKGDNLAEWLFEDAEAPGYYYISTEVNGVKQYLNMELKTSAQGSLTLSASRQAIHVTVPSTGKVLLAAGGGYINSSNSREDHGFWVHNSTGDTSTQSLCRITDVGEAFLTYDLNVTDSRVGSHGVGAYDQWLNDSPSIKGSIQNITGEGNALYRVAGADGDGYYTREYTSSYMEEIASKMKESGKSPGKQFRFDGWQAVIDGNTYLFAEDAAAVLEADGIHITDVGGAERVLPTGTTLTGQWTEVSDIATFYVNYSGTILDTEGDVSGRNQGQFTRVIGIGHVYYGAVTVGNDVVFGNAANEEIRIKFTKRFNPDDPECQLVMDYVTVDENGNANLYKSADGINDTELETALLDYIKTSGTQIKISTADNKNNPEIENENATPDHYSVRWYVLKEQQDGWHIDGVMVAKSAEITVAKTFSGLSDAQVKGMLGKQNDSYDNSFRIPVGLGESAQSYITMVADAQIGEGQYSYYGQEQAGNGPGGQSYNWILNAITDEKYTLSEQNYELEGYDVSTITVRYYKDENGVTRWDYSNHPTTEEMEVIGGKTTAVTFNNLYTRKNTGALSIIKRAKRTGENNYGGVLGGAEFTLTNSNGGEVVASAVSNSRGSVYFNNLNAGTYILEETRAPEGYLETSDTWTVEVKRSTGGTVKVTVYENDEHRVKQESTAVVCYNGGVTDSYLIENMPANGTIHVTKTFEGLTAVQIEKIVQGSSSGNSGGYYICLNESDDGEGENGTKLYLHDAARSQDGDSFFWTVPELAVTGVDGTHIDYQISEHNYLTGDYADTVITAAVDGAAKEVVIERETAGDAAAYVRGVQFSADTGSTVELTNRYINHFTLSLQKMDSSTGEPLRGAEFAIYGAYRESEDTSESLTYKDPVTGEMKTVYYISKITSGEDGLATQKDLKLSRGDNTFVYILNEDKAPDGYMASTEPTIITVYTDSAKYDAGVYTTEVDNSKLVDITIEKKVTGNLGEHQKAFRFTAKVTDSSNAPVTGLTAPENAGYTVNPDGTLSFELKHKENIKLKLPQGYQVTVTEDPEDSLGYKTTYFSDGKPSSSETFTVSEGMVLTVQNDKNSNIDTGIVLPRHSFAVLLAAAGFFMVIFLKGRRHDEK